MRSKARSLLRASALAALLIVGTAMPATAVTVSPSGAYALTGTSTATWTTTSNGQTVACTGSSIAATVAADGTSSIAAGDFVMTGCSNALLGTFRIATNAVARGGILLTRLPDGRIGLALSITVPRGGLSLSTGSCAVTASGVYSITGLYRGPLPITIVIGGGSGLTATAAFTVDTAVGCTPLFTTIGLGITGGGSYDYGRGFTVSG